MYRTSQITRINLPGNPSGQGFHRVPALLDLRLPAQSTIPVLNYSLLYYPLQMILDTFNLTFS